MLINFSLSIPNNTFHYYIFVPGDLSSTPLLTLCFPPIPFKIKVQMELQIGSESKYYWDRALEVVSMGSLTLLGGRWYFLIPLFLEMKDLR